VQARTVMAHVRKATQGNVSLANCHPFLREWGGRHWAFAHNGDLKGFEPQLDGSFRPVGQTDSERAFCWLMQQLRSRYGKTGLPEWPDLAPALAAWAARLSAHGCCNMLLTDGRALFAHASTKLAWLQRQHPFGQTQLVDCDLGIDLAAAHTAGERVVLLATAALTHGEPWQCFAPGESRVFAQGECIWSQVPSTALRHAAARVQLQGKSMPAEIAVALRA
jgi:predicted glutamine amidotransferase